MTAHLTQPSTAARADARRWRILAVASAAQFLAILDLFAVNAAFPALERSFHGTSLAEVSWVLNAYTIVLAAMLVPAGRLADDIGRKPAFLIGMVLFGVASVGCALSPALSVLVGARVVQAVAGAILIPTSLGLALPAFPKHEHATVMGIWTAVAAVGAGSGPVAGGLLLNAGWRWIFLINIPVVLVAVLVGRRLLPATARGQRKRLDLPGAALVLATAAGLTTVFTQAPVWGYGSAAVLGLALATVLAGVLTVRHLRRTPDPVISFALFRHRLFGVAVSGVFLYYLAFAAMILAATLFFTGRWHYSVVAAALGIAPMPASTLATAPLSGRIVARVGARTSAVLGGLTLAAGCGWWALTATDRPQYLFVFLPGAVLAGVSTALLQPPLFGSAAALPSSQTSLATAVLMMSRQIASALGIAVLTAILGHQALHGFRVAWLAMCAAALASAVTSTRFRGATTEQPEGATGP
ncbi:MFS transporter [Kitasatospora viridis]|uniref:EmrB/QacA subfamily drug resistance transporter n=1 Tax=Kitasatospora viridis TaxID=281105 RepID=A0A561SDJ1_9ACTN|nr:MFS transporter [Kitasatospora viridis]TWF72943.1 EmrB/QacA subfamily drug resistance transporter [Kitasatospora viridis]